MLHKIIKRAKAISPHTMAACIQKILACSLLFLAAILLLFLIKESWQITLILLKENSSLSSYLIIEKIIIWFLYFEFIALIAKYFEAGFHFPLRYFIYIGITAIVRLIIIDHEHPTATLIYSIAILVLLGALYIANSSLLRRM